MNDSVLSGRFLVSGALWKAIEPLIRAVKGTTTAPSKLSPRMFVEAILFQARTGNPWRDLPREFGNWNAAYKRFRRWERWGLWKQIWKHLQSLDDKPLRSLFIDSTVVRAHQHATGAPKKSGAQAKQAMGRSSGGWTTKLHAACADERVAVSFSLSPGQSHDATAFPSVWEGVPKSRWLDAAVMDKAYDSNNIRKFLENQGIEAVIPPKSLANTVAKRSKTKKQSSRSPKIEGKSCNSPKKVEKSSKKSLRSRLIFDYLAFGSFFSEEIPLSGLPLNITV